MVGGVEVLPFGFLIFVAVVLLIVNIWAVVDAKLAAESAAREAGRTYVESVGTGSPDRQARRAARDAVEGAGRDPGRLDLTIEGGDGTRCTLVRVETSYPVPALTLPFIGGFGHGFTTHGRHQEIVDPFRSGTGRETTCG